MIIKRHPWWPSSTTTTHQTHRPDVHPPLKNTLRMNEYAECTCFPFPLYAVSPDPNRGICMTCKSAIQYHHRTPAANTAARCQRQPWKLRLLNTGLLHGLYCITLSCFYSVQSTLYCIEKTRPLFILDTRPGWDRPWDGWLPTWSTGPLSGRVWLGVQVRLQLFSPDSSSYFVRRMRSCIISPFFFFDRIVRFENM